MSDQPKRRQVLKGIGAVTAGAGLAGCLGGQGGGGGQSGGSIDTLDELVEAAQEEGTFNSMSGMDIESWEALEASMQEVYPWAESEFTLTETAQQISRISSAQQANNVQTDFLATGRAAGLILADLDTFVAVDDMPVISQRIEEMDPIEGTVGEYFAPQRAQAVCVYYNTNNVSESELPDSYEGFADEKWRGRIVMQSPAALSSTGGLWATLAADDMWGEERTRQFSQDLSNIAQFISSNTDSYVATAQGEFDVCFGMLNDLAAAIRDDNVPPIDVSWKPANPVGVLRMTNSWVLKDGPHPNMARLATHYLLSEHGQKAILRGGRLSASGELNRQDPIYGQIIPDDMMDNLRAVAFNNPDYFRNPDAWAEKFREWGVGIGDGVGSG